ncbi:MAG: YeeE/YedE thiosulfate transporter family protein [Betaproteobacteria bacterium]
MYRARGSMAAIGHMKGVADLFGIPLSGLPAWLVWRAYYLSQMPTLGRKLRIFVDLAKESVNLPPRTLRLVALFAGAMVGGFTAGRFRSTRICGAQLLKCFGVGLLMGWGSLLIPGGNDGLILVGIPLLWPYAWIAFLTMCVTIGAALLVERSMAGQGVEQAFH